MDDNSSNSVTPHPQSLNSNMIIETKENVSNNDHVGSIFVQNTPKIPPFYVSMKMFDKVSYYFLINGGSSPNALSKLSWRS